MIVTYNGRKLELNRCKVYRLTPKKDKVLVYYVEGDKLYRLGEWTVHHIVKDKEYKGKNGREIVWCDNGSNLYKYKGFDWLINRIPD